MAKQFIRAFYEAGAREWQPGEPIRFVASTENIARDGLVIAADGWDLGNYRKNPVVLWAHDYMGQRAPIGRAEARVEDGSLVADVTFDQGDEFARMIERKYRDGFMHAVSVGWNSLQMEPVNNPDVFARVTRAELLDISAVPVPGDPDALIERQLRALNELRGAEGDETSLPASPLPPYGGAKREGRGAEDAEGLWEDMAAEMVAVFLPGSDDSEADREGRYRALLPRYRRMGKVAPEFLADEDLTGLSSAELRGHFLEGEWELSFPGLKSGASGERKGAVLSARNLEDLGRAVELINGVVARAKKEETSPQPSPEGEGEEEEESRAAVEALNRVLVGLKNLEV